LTQDLRVETTDEPAFTPQRVDFQESLRTALNRRPDLRTAALAIQNSALDKKGARNNLLPEANLTFSTGFQGLSGDPNPAANPFTSTATTPVFPLLPNGRANTAVPPIGGIPGSFGSTAGAGVLGTPFAGQTSFNDATGTFFDGNGFSFWSVGLMLTYPIGNRDARAQYAKSKLALEKSKRELARAEQLATLDVKTVIETLDAAERAVDSTREAREVAEEQLEAEEKKLAVGLTTNFEVLRFQRDLTDRRREEIRALTSHKISLVELSRATGTILDDLNIEFLED
ncbi:MAG: TolC family protein, partial [Myxococcota bacterium]